MLFSACLVHESLATEAQSEYRGSTMVVEAPSVEVDMSVLDNEGDAASSEPAEGEPLRFKNVGSENSSSEEYYGTNTPDENRYSKNSNEELEKIEKEINQLETETSSYSSGHRDSNAIILKPKAPKLNFSQQRSQYYSKIYTPYSNAYKKPYNSNSSLYSGGDSARRYTPSYPSSSSRYSPDSYSAYLEKYRSLNRSYSPYLSGNKAYRPKNQYLEGDGPQVQAHAVTEVEREVIKDDSTKIKLTPPCEEKKEKTAAIAPIETAETKAPTDSTLSNLEATEKKLKALQEEIDKEVARQKSLTKSLSEENKQTAEKQIKPVSPAVEKEVAQKSESKKQLQIIKEKGKATEKPKEITKEKAKKREEEHMEDAYSAASAEAEDEAAVKARIEADIKAQAAAEAEARALAKQADAEKKKNKSNLPPPKDNLKAVVKNITKDSITAADKEGSDYSEDSAEVKMITSPLASRKTSDEEEIDVTTATPDIVEQPEESSNVYAQRALESAGEQKKKKKNLISIQENNSNLPVAEITKRAVESKQAATEITKKAIEVSEPVEEPSESELVEVTAPTNNAKLADASMDISKPAMPSSSAVAAAPAPTNATKTATDSQPKETLTSIAFAKDSSVLSDKAKEELVGVIDFLKQSPDIRVQIQAFSYAKNQTKSDARRMSLSRGLVIRSYLTEKGIKPVRLDIRALGDNTDKTPIDRVDIVLLD